MIPQRDLRVMVVAGDPLARSTLASLLEEAGLTVTGRVSSVPELPAETAVHQPDIILWDPGWYPGPSLDDDLVVLGEAIQKLPPLVALLPNAERAPDVWSAGVRALVFRDAGATVLAAALLAAAAGLVALDPALAEIILPAGDRQPEPLVETLTPREHEVLQRLADGLSNRAIAHQLGISEHTVKFHVNALMGKLAAQSRTEAVVRATRLGLIVL